MPFKLLQTKCFYIFEVYSNSLSSVIIEHANHGETINFTTSLRQAMDPHIEKCRQTRAIRRNTDLLKYGYFDIREICDSTFFNLIEESNISYDTQRFPIAERFADMLGYSIDDLPAIHLKYGNDRGLIKNRDEKRRMLSPLLKRVHRQPFHDTFIDFILNFIAPHVKEITNCNRIFFQSFPCIRVVRPHEFSIGPHCDSAYGFSQANINFYVPLTRIYGSNSLVLESRPGSEDWHTIELQNGWIKRFWGAQCSHFTPENATIQTRISLDFRVIDEKYWTNDHDQFTSTPGYYASCRFVHTSTFESSLLHDETSLNINGHWELDSPVLSPDYRVGFPFERGCARE